MTQDPSLPSESPLPQVPPKDAVPPAHRMARFGLALFAGPVFGVLGKIIMMVLFYRKLMGSGPLPASAVADGISGPFWFSAFGALVGLVGAVLLCIALRRGNRESWVRQTTFGLCFVWAITLFPFGLLVGLVVGVVAHLSAKQPV